MHNHLSVTSTCCPWGPQKNKRKKEKKVVPEASSQLHPQMGMFNTIMFPHQQVEQVFNFTRIQVEVWEMQGLGQ